MKRFLKSLAIGILLALPWYGDVSAQQVNNYWCNSATVPCPPSAWTPTSAANPFPTTAGTIITPSAVEITDGTNGPVAVKAPSTAAVVTDKALVMQLTPNSPGVVALGQTTKSASIPVTIASDQYVDPCQSPNIAKSSVAISIATATTTSLVGVSGSTTVYVCGFVFTASQVITTANTLVFEYGTGATCTSPTALTGTLGAGGITAGEPILVHAGNAGQTIFKSAASAGICALTAIGASGSFQGVLTYVQQ